MCLQYVGGLSQVVDFDIGIIMPGSTGNVRERSIRPMLPLIFGPLDLAIAVFRYRA